MAESSGFFNSELVDSKPDRLYLAEQFAQFFGQFIGNGVFASNSNNLQIVENTTPSMNLIVRQGSAFINGYWYESDADMELSIDIASGVNERRDLVVVRWDLTTRSIYIAVVKGEDNSTAIRPELTRNENIFELGLAEIYLPRGNTSIGNALITDLRFDNAYCGIVTGLVDQINTTELFAQYEATFREFNATLDREFQTLYEKFNADFNSLFSTQTTRFDDLYSTTNTSLQNLLTQYKNSFDELQASQTTRFNEMFTSYTSQFDKLQTDTKSSLETMMNNYKDIFDQMQTDYNATFQDLFTQMHTAFGDELASNRQNIQDLIDNFNTIFASSQTDKDDRFNTWFESIKGKLAEDIAGSLQLQIDQLKEDLEGASATPININETLVESVKNGDRFTTEKGRVVVSKFYGNTILQGTPSPDDSVAKIRYVGEPKSDGGVPQVILKTNSKNYFAMEGDYGTANGLTITGTGMYFDQEIIINGRATSDTVLFIGYYPQPIIGREYTFSVYNDDLPQYARIYLNGENTELETNALFKVDSQNKTQTKIMTEVDSYINGFMYVRSQTVFNNFKLKVQLELGNKQTDYVRASRGTTSISLNNRFTSNITWPYDWYEDSGSLLSVPDGTRDEIDLDIPYGNNYKKNLLIATLSESSNWSIGNLANYNYGQFRSVVFGIKFSNMDAPFSHTDIREQSLISDFLPCFNMKEIAFNASQEGIWYGGVPGTGSLTDTDCLCYMVLDSNRIADVTGNSSAERAKNYLNSKMPKIVYKLAEPLYAGIDYQFTTSAYEQETVVELAMYKSDVNNQYAEADIILGAEKVQRTIEARATVPRALAGQVEEYIFPDRYSLSVNDEAFGDFQVIGVTQRRATSLSGLSGEILSPATFLFMSYNLEGRSTKIYVPEVKVSFLKRGANAPWRPYIQVSVIRLQSATDLYQDVVILLQMTHKRTDDFYD